MPLGVKTFQFIGYSDASPDVVAFNFVQGDDVQVQVTMYPTEGSVTPVDLTGYTGQLSLSNVASGGTRTVDVAGVIAVPATGQCLFPLTVTETAVAGRYDIAAFLSIGGDVQHLFGGTVMIWNTAAATARGI